MRQNFDINDKQRLCSEEDPLENSVAENLWSEEDPLENFVAENLEVDKNQQMFLNLVQNFNIMNQQHLPEEESPAASIKSNGQIK